MLVGGRGAYSDIEVIDLNNLNATCSKPQDIPLQEGSVGTFIDGIGPFVCEDKYITDCYVYNGGMFIDLLNLH